MSQHLQCIGLGYDNGELLRLEDAIYLLAGATLMAGAAESQERVEEGGGKVSGAAKSQRGRQRPGRVRKRQVEGCLE